MSSSSKKVLAILVALLTVFFLLIQQANRRNLKKIRIAIDEDKTSINKLSIKSVQDALLAEKVEQLTINLKNDQEKCIKIAEWIAKNISNRSDPSFGPYGEFLAFSSRSGLCGHRSGLFIKMLSYINIPARRFNIYNYPFPGTGHSCVQAYYNHCWHFFDPTYAGYFIKNENILSFDEIQKEASQDNHLKYLVVFPYTSDKTIYSDSEEFEQALDNEIPNFYSNSSNDNRMKYFYNKIKQAKTFGFLYKGGKILNIDFNHNRLKHGQWSLGGGETKVEDLEKSARNEKLSQYLNKVGNCIDNFQYNWNFYNLNIKKTYSIKFTGSFIFTQIKSQEKSNEDDRGPFKFVIKGTGAEILSSKEIDHDTKTLKINFKPTQINPTIHISYVNEKKTTRGCLYVNKIEINEK